jgi:protease-4
MKSFLKYMLATIVGFIVVNLILFFVFLLIVSSLMPEDEKVQVKNNSVLHLRLDFPIVDRGSDNPFSNMDFTSFEAKSNPGLNEILKSIRKAKEDSLVKGIFLDVSSLDAGLATIEEIREALIVFKKSGKFIIAFNDLYTQTAYYLVSVADKIYLNPAGVVELKGLRSDVMFFKGALEKLGIEPIIIRHGKFKSAIEPFILTEMSEANKEQTMTYIGSMWNHMLAGISASRNISVDSLNLFADSMLVRNAQTSLELRLVDSLKYYDEVMEDLKAMAGIDKNKDLELVSLADYQNTPPLPGHERPKDKIAVIYATGQIDMGKGDEETIGSEGLSETIREAREDTTIKAVVLRINSPGGSALASESIWREVVLTQKVKPVIVSMGDVAASGGYYIACPADVIVANPVTITGSIGVFGVLWNGEKLMKEKLGITIDGVQTNQHSDIGSPFRKIHPSEEAVIQQSVEEIYQMFIGHVAEGRKMDVSMVDSIGQGRVWSGINAKEIGLVDELGGLERAIEIAKEKAGIKGEAKIVEFPKKLPFFDQLMKDLGESARMSIIQEDLGVDYRYYKALRNVRKMNGVQARMAFEMIVY